MLHTITIVPKAPLCIARSSPSTLLPLRASTSAIRFRHAHNISHHASPPSRQLHGHPAAHHPGRDEPPPISTVNDAEVAHFSRLSALWWDERGEFALLHKMNPHRIRFIREKVLQLRRDEQPYTSSGAAPTTPPPESSRVLEGMDVLDVGCGGGILSEVHFFLFLPLHHGPNLSVATTLVPRGRADVLDFIIDLYTHRASRVSARTRSPSTRQRRMSASRRATQRQTPASPRCRTVMRRPRRSCRSQSGSMSSARRRSSSTWITQLRFCVRVQSSSRYVYPLPLPLVSSRPHRCVISSLRPFF